MKRLILLIIVLCFLLIGCGNKSDKELTNIEQFKCQDSIQTVFDVLGEVEIENNAYIGECYTYEDLNLYGYNGKAFFRVRDDKKTISSFEGSLTLNKKEFEDVLSQLEDKYGEYKKSEYTNQIAYVWKFSEDKAKELGYNRISLSDYGDKKVYVDFSDEWSIYKDEAYYKHLEEEEQKEYEINVLAKKTYNIGEDTFNFSFGQKENGEYSFTLFCRIEDKIDAYSTHVSLNTLFNSDEEALKVTTDTMNFTYSIFVSDGTMLMRSKNFLYLTKDSEIIDVQDYFSAEWLLEALEGDAIDSDYSDQVINFLVDFIQNE